MREVAKMGCHSGYDDKDKMPFVCIHLQDAAPFQIGATEALSLANMLIDAAHCATATGFFFKFLNETMEVPKEVAEIAACGFNAYFEQNMPSACDHITVRTAEQLNAYSDYLYDLLVKQGEVPLDINEWVGKQTKEDK